MKKVLYLLPAVTVCAVYLLLFSLVASTGSGIRGFQPVVIAYIGLPVLGTIFLWKGKWWGGLIGMAMGLLLIYNNLNYHGHQHVNIDLPLGTVFAVYYGVMAVLCGWKKENKTM